VVDIKLKNFKKADVNDTFIKIIPLALILLIVPMIVYLKEVILKGAVTEFNASTSVYDFFSYYKVLWLLVFSVSSILFASFYAYAKKLKFKLSFGFIPLFVYYLFVFLSTSYSEYHEVALNGFTDRFEGFWVISCYVIICFIAAHFITYKKDIKLLFGALIICTTLLCILGISQFFGFDFLQMDFFKKLMLPSEAHKLADSLSFKFPTRYIYLTLFNPNYVGSFCAMVLPISVVILLFTKKIYVKILSGVLSGLILVNLIGSRSSAGYIGVLITVLFLIVLLRKKILKYWIPILALVIFCSGVLIYINQSYSGLISNEVRGFLPQKQSPIVYKDRENKYITDMTIDKNIMTIYMGDIFLNVKFNSQDKTLSFLDDTGKDVTVVKSPSDNTLLTFDSPKYLGISIKITERIFTITSRNIIYYATLDDTGIFKFLNQIGKPADIVHPAYVGFEGYEKWASSRGYIWSRSIPLLKDTIILGHGPDTYALYFPQNDFKGKVLSFNTPYILVDKPHNMYLQMAINTGVVSLIAFLVFVLWYIGSSFRLYFKPKKDDSFYYIAGSACVLSVIGFLVSGLANDSNVNISPIFWIMLGIGFACNRLYKKELLIVVQGSSVETPATIKPSKKPLKK